MYSNGKNRKMSFYVRKLARNEQMETRFMFMKIVWALGVVCPCPRAIYMYMTKIFKHLFSGNGLVNQSQTLCGAKLGMENESLHK